MDINPYDKVSVNIIPRDILSKVGSFYYMGLYIQHNGKGRVIIKDAYSGALYSDSDYYTSSEVQGVVNNIIEVKWGK